MSSEGAGAMGEENDKKSMLVPRRRFPEFREAAGWKTIQLDKLISTVTPPKKIPTTEYLAEGQFPIIDQGQSEIAGWTDDPESLVEENEPLIIFGDHTCALKLLRMPFAQGADGIKILKGNGPATTDFLYQHLCFRPVLPEEYKRHFSILKDKVIAYPEAKSGEQQKIAACLSSLDELVAAETQKLDALNIHKKGLMQKLFPREGETVPRLRFPEFREAGDWQTVPMGSLLARNPEYGVNAPASPYSEDRPTYLRITDIDEDGRFLSASKVSVDIVATDDNYLEPGDIVLARTGASVGKSYRYRKEDGRLVFAGFLIRIRPEPKKINPIFLGNFLSTQQYWDWVGVTSARSGQPGINGTEYSSLPVPVPSLTKYDDGLSEQRRIADCLSSLDDLISAQSQKIDALKTHKKGLMQQLFPLLDEVPA